MRKLSCISLVLLVSVAMQQAMAASPVVQLAPPNHAGVTMGQLYYMVRDVDANVKFWTVLGAAPVTAKPNFAVMSLPGLFIFLSQGEPSGPMEGSVFNHIGLLSPDLVQTLARMKSAGYRAEPAPTQKAAWDTGGRRETIYVWGPEGQRLEVMQEGAQNTKFVLADGREVARPRLRMISLHHVHWAVPETDVNKIQSWYVQHFQAEPGKRWNYTAADLPGLNINISGDPNHPAPSKGRMLDHIGFEVKNLKGFCRKLEASGVKLDQPYTKQPSGLATAYLTDPWGTYIELTEGLTRHYQVP